MTKVLRLIGGAMRDEHGARLYYTHLIATTPDAQLKKAIRKIRADEIRHYKMLEKQRLRLKK